MLEAARLMADDSCSLCLGDWTTVASVLSTELPLRAHAITISIRSSCLRQSEFISVIILILVLYIFYYFALRPTINPLNPELNPICFLLALLEAHHFLHVSRIRVKSLTFRLLMSYIYGAPILDVSRSHTTTQHSR